jgi:predicted amidohydrolase YtcJ
MKMKSKNYLLSSLILGLFSLHSQATQLIEPPPMGTPKNITVFVAKKVVTMDPSLPIATAVAVSDGKILSVGSLEDLKPWTDKYPTTINRQFADKVLYPGFVEAHGHPLLGGLTQTSLPLTYQPLPNPWGPAFPGVRNLKAAIEQLKKYSAQIKDPSELLLAFGYDIAAMGQIPNRQILDEVSTTRPIIVWDNSEHNMFLNSAAIARYKITGAAIKNIIGVGLDQSGNPNGEFLGKDASEYILSVAGKEMISPAKIPTAMLYSNDLAQQNGITTSSDMAFGVINIDLETATMKAITASKATSLRIVPVAMAQNFVQKYGNQSIEKVKELQKLNTDRLMFHGVKFMSDDAYLANTMKVEGPGYTDGHQGVSFYTSPQGLYNDMKPWWDANMQLHVHSNGTGGNQNTLNALQLLQDSKPRFDHRFTLQHFGLPTTAMVMKMKTLGAVASVNPAYFYTRANIQGKDFGVDRVSSATRVGYLNREGIVVSLHSDNPVAPPMPLTEVWAVVNRFNIETGSKKWAPAEAVSVADAMKMITINAAYTVGVEDKVGTIEPGKYADFAVLGDDPQTVPSIKIKDIPVVATVLGGRVIPVSETKKPRPLE